MNPIFQNTGPINGLNENSLMRPYTSLRQDVNGVCFHMTFLRTQPYGVSFVVLRKVGYGIPFWQNSLKKRLKAGRTVTPTYAIIDSQSVKTTDVAENRGIDGGKKSKEENATLLLIPWAIF